jgi:hypothetical protein
MVMNMDERKKKSKKKNKKRKKKENCQIGKKKLKTDGFVRLNKA